MGTFTNFIKLHKPGETEKYNINVFNANAELIDSALARMEQENENRDNLLDTLKTKATDLVDGLLSKEDHAKYEDANNKKHTHNNKAVLDGITATLVSAWNTVTNKVDKVAGKGLSTHDYTTEEKNKLNGIESGAKANVQADWNVSDTDSDAYIKNKPDLTAYAPSVMTGATADAAGRAGSVPAPAKGKQNAFLRGDGTWQGTSTSLTATVPGIPLDQTAGKALKDQLDAQNNNLSELGGRLNNSGWIRINNYLSYRKFAQVVTVRVMSYITKSNNWEEIGVLPFHTGADVYSTAYDSSAEASAAIYIGGTHVKIKAVASNRYIYAVITIVCA